MRADKSRISNLNFDRSRATGTELEEQAEPEPEQEEEPEQELIVERNKKGERTKRALQLNKTHKGKTG